jgi:hypothetical protein
MDWIEKYTGKLQRNPLKTSLVTVLVLFAIKAFFSLIYGAIHARYFGYILTSLFESIVFDLIYRFFFWFIIGASLYEWGMRLQNFEIENTIKKRTLFYILLGVLAAAIASWHAVLPLVALVLLAYLSYLTGQEP